MNINPSANPPSSPFRLFISYARENEACKDRLKINLSPLQRNGWVYMWDDREISAGADWREEIEAAMVEADVAIFLLEEYFLASNFCMDVEVATFLKRHRDEGTLILFILTNHCMWDEFDFIRKFQLLPRNAIPILDPERTSHALAYTEIAKEIKNTLAQYSPKPRVAKTLLMQEGKCTEANDLVALLAKLPGATTHLFGRENELAQINSWKDHKGVFLWVADGGTGKSALVRWWLVHQEWPAGTRFLGHSFYSQGSHNQATSSRSFLLDALKQLNVQHEINAADDELGRLLAETIAQTSTVLVLDGIEPLQQISEDEKLNGMVKDRGLAALLEGLAKTPGQALCLASSRLPISDAAIAKAAYFHEEKLDILPPVDARELLHQRGVHGKDNELYNMAERCGYHPLALVLAAEFCHTFLQDQAAEFLQREWQPKSNEKHAATVMAWFDSALAEEHQALDRELVRILGLFDRPAPWGALMALKEAVPIAGLTVALHEAEETVIFESLARLCQWGLLSADLAHREPELDAHPLVREHFGSLLEQEQAEAWSNAHNVLLEWFCKQPEKRFPDTLEEMELLCRAIWHGCRAKRYLTAATILQLRIMRTTGYAQFQLGGSSLILSAISGFFPNGWMQPPVASNAGLADEALGEEIRAWLVGVVAQNLEFLGYLEESLEPYRANQQYYSELKNWVNFSHSCFNLVETLTPLGQWREAKKICYEALEASKQIKDKVLRQESISYACSSVGLVLHARGNLANAIAMHSQSEAIQKTLHNQHKLAPPQLQGTQNYAYCQLLLEMADRRKRISEVLERGRASLKFDKRVNHLISIALSNSIVGSCAARLDKPEAGERLDNAVSIMKQANLVHGQPPMHLARASYLRPTRNYPAAWADHDAAYTIAQRGNMRTYLAECALLAGNLCLDEARVPDAAAQYATAAQLILEDGYGRRYTELHLLHARLLHAQHDPAAAQALAEAEARIREVGQWFFWRELCAVAKEIGAPDPGKCPA